jgi:integrase
MEMELREGIAKLISVPKGKRDVLVWDSTTPGFFLRKFASGRAMWGVRFHLPGGMQRRIHLYDAGERGSLAKARKAALDVRAKARLGEDVVAERTAAAEASSKTVTVGKIVELYLADRRPAWRPRYSLEITRHLTKDWAPLAGSAIRSVTRQNVVDVIDKIAAGQGRVAADRAKTALSGLFVWAIDKGFADATPILHIKRRSENDVRERTLSPEELAEVWRAAGAVGGDYGSIVRLLMLTGQRRSEIGGLAWAEVRENGDGRRLELPPEKTKNHRGHIVPLSEEAWRCLPSRADRAMVFGRRFDTGYSGWSRSKAGLDEAIAAARRARRIKGTMPEWRLHDLRRSFVTLVSELGFAQPHVIEAIVNHVSGAKSGVAGVYNKATYLAERRQALEAWGAWVRQLA